MNLTTACLRILTQISDTIRQLTPEDFIKPSLTLSHATIGQHLRHTLEFFICFRQGLQRGVINYDKRNHDKILETDKILALHALEEIKKFIERLPENQPLKLEVNYDGDTDAVTTISTDTSRELVYNMEHAVHHMALMKIGIRDVASYVKIPIDFGVASSTVRYKEMSASAH